MTLNNLFQKLLQSSQGKNIAEQMFNSMNSDQQMKFLQRPNFKDYIANAASTEVPNFDQGIVDEATLLDGLKAGNVKATLPDGTKITSVGDELGHMMNQKGNFGDLGSLALGAAKEHPFKAAGLVGAGLGNIGGLTDNDKIGGQLGGLALGGLVSYLAGANPYAAAMMTMGGGELGALLDKLRARKEMEQSNIVSPNQNTPRLPGLIY